MKVYRLFIQNKMTEKWIDYNFLELYASIKIAQSAIPDSINWKVNWVNNGKFGWGKSHNFNIREYDLRTTIFNEEEKSCRISKMLKDEIDRG